jgi:hypothetical protein
VLPLLFEWRYFEEGGENEPSPLDEKKKRQKSAFEVRSEESESSHASRAFISLPPSLLVALSPHLSSS